MNRRELIAEALEAAGLAMAVRDVQSLSGGCIHEVSRVVLDDGTSVVAKIASAAQAAWLAEERDGLLALYRTQTVLAPEPIGLLNRETASVLLTRFLAPGRADDSVWRAFGEALAALHAADVGARYGFHGDNHLGSTPQPNDWHDDWVEFNRECRLGHQLQLAQRNNLLSRDEAKRIERVTAGLETLIPRTPKPALLHGDLWSGNALATTDENGNARIGVIDPACSIGDGYADIAMMQLFGGFPHACYEAYESNTSDHEHRDTRIAVYQLYHVLNHVNIFGRGYVAQAMNLARSLG